MLPCYSDILPTGTYMYFRESVKVSLRTSPTGKLDQSPEFVQNLNLPTTLTAAVSTSPCRGDAIDDKR